MTAKVELEGLAGKLARLPVRTEILDGAMPGPQSVVLPIELRDTILAALRNAVPMLRTHLAEQDARIVDLEAQIAQFKAPITLEDTSEPEELALYWYQQCQAERDKTATLKETPDAQG